MAFAGLEPERLRLDWVSASEGERFSRIVSEFTDSLRALGPVKWRANPHDSRVAISNLPLYEGVPTESPISALEPRDFDPQIAASIQDTARQLLSTGQVSCVIGYEAGTHGRTRPAFVRNPAEVERLVWNRDCSHNLTTYVHTTLYPPESKRGAQPKPVAVVAKPCDSRAINVLLAENRFERDQVYVIGVACEGMRELNGGSSKLQDRCLECEQRLPLVYDTMVGEAPEMNAHPVAAPRLAGLDARTPAERMEYWLSQFDRCIRCYACRQACPMCDCPTCLYERDDSLWVGMGIGLNEKRTFHLGRAYHLAGRCVDCHECERVCPMEIPISLLNGKLIQEMQSVFGHRAGLQPVPSPFVTILNGEERLP
jgi:ferredoxin